MAFSTEYAASSVEKPLLVREGGFEAFDPGLCGAKAKSSLAVETNWLIPSGPSLTPAAHGSSSIPWPAGCLLHRASEVCEKMGRSTCASDASTIIRSLRLLRSRPRSGHCQLLPRASQSRELQLSAGANIQPFNVPPPHKPARSHQT